LNTFPNEKYIVDDTKFECEDRKGYSNPGGYIKRTSMGGIKFISTSIPEERG
jgi:hypothetical protein